MHLNWLRIKVFETEQKHLDHVHLLTIWLPLQNTERLFFLLNIRLVAEKSLILWRFQNMNDYAAGPMQLLVLLANIFAQSTSQTPLTHNSNIDFLLTNVVDPSQSARNGLNISTPWSCQRNQIDHPIWSTLSDTIIMYLFKYLLE